MFAGLCDSCYSSVTNSLLGGNWRHSERIETAVLPDNLFVWQQGKISVQPHPTLCIQFLNRENNDKNNTFPLGKQICFTMVWGCAETLPAAVSHIADGCVNNIRSASNLTENRSLTCKCVPKRQLPSNTRIIFHVIHLRAWIRNSRKEKPYSS